MKPSYDKWWESYDELIGVEVKIHRPKITGEHPTWTPEMDRYDGTLGIIKSVRRYDKGICVYINAESDAMLYSYNIKWLEPIRHFEFDDMSESDISYFEEYLSIFI